MPDLRSREIWFRAVRDFDFDGAGTHRETTSNPGFEVQRVARRPRSRHTIWGTRNSRERRRENPMRPSLN